VVAPHREEESEPEASSQVSVVQAFVAQVSVLRAFAVQVLVVQVFAPIRVESPLVLLRGRLAAVVSRLHLPLWLARAILEHFVLSKAVFRFRRFVGPHLERESRARPLAPVWESPAFRSPSR
jgi:hypothetical protein